jgi:hypothetical protein
MHSTLPRPSRPRCYICCATEKLTDDHLPPKGFFPPKERENLITAPLCDKCHKTFTKVDETMRAWLSAAGGKSDAGKWIWKNKVMGSSFRRSPRLLAHIRKRHFQPIFDQTTGNMKGGLITYPQANAIPFIRRLTKGLLYTLHPEYDYHSDYFAVDYQLPTRESISVIGELVSKLPRIAKGNGVFRVWHGIVSETHDAGVCVYLFYDAVCFLCFFGKHEQFKQRFENGYEEQGFPPQL